MKQYIAIVRLSRRQTESAGMVAHSPPAWYGLLEQTLAQQPGIGKVSHDPAAGSLLVWFDRGSITVADVVRLIEDAGVGVTGVAQASADAMGFVEAVGA